MRKNKIHRADVMAAQNTACPSCGYRQRSSWQGPRDERAFWVAELPSVAISWHPISVFAYLPQERLVAGGGFEPPTFGL